jgi:branched-chain amino acid transport system substrate-binding protein
MRASKTLLLATIFAASSFQAGQAEILVGVAAPLTGTFSWGGGATLRSAELAVAQVNAAGGVLGEQIELLTADDFCDAEQAVAAANKLLALDVDVVIGHDARVRQSRHRRSTPTPES